MTYTIKRSLGEGESAVSFLASDETGAQVVIKRFKNALDERGYDRIQKEIAILQSIDHPQIPKYLGVYQETEYGRTIVHLVQEFIDGVALIEHVRVHRPSMEQVLGWCAQTLDILTYLHSLAPPIIHRDIKWSNLMLRSRFRFVARF